MANLETTAVFSFPAEMTFDEKDLFASFTTLLNQVDPPVKIHVVSAAANESRAAALVQLAGESGITAQGFVAHPTLVDNLAPAIEGVETGHVLVLQNHGGPVFLRRSALTHFSWAARRNPEAGYFYSDYERRDPDGETHEVHLLPYHAGRLRDNMDFGQVFLAQTGHVKRVGGIDQSYQWGTWYDLRLRLGATAPVIHISNRFAGSLYTVAAAGNKHDVFDYLLSGKEVQLEMEQIVTTHLKRISAYLKPGDYPGTVAYTDGEDAGFSQCLASVIIPVNNRPEFIADAITSVQEQTVSSVETIVVVNGGESDPTIPAVKAFQPGGHAYDPNKPPVHLLIHDVNSIGLCLNSGLSLARGKYYVQLDSDDRLKSDAVEKIIAVFDSDPQIAMVIGSYEVWQKEDDGRYFRREDIPIVTHDEWTDDNGRNNLLRINGAGAPRAAHIKILREMGWFSVNDIPFSRNYGEDYEMVLKISERYRIGRVWEPIYEVVRHSGGTDHAIDPETIDRNDNAKDMMRLEAIKRRQKNASH